MKTLADLIALTQQRTWDKDLVLWVGYEKTLTQALGQGQYTMLDLLDVFDEDRLPMDDEETRTQLVRGLRKRLRAIDAAADKRTILIVRSIGLLARYRAGVKDFYDWFCSDFAMAVLVLEGPIENYPWPEEVRCDPDKLIDHFQAPTVVKQVFRERGENEIS